MTRAEQIAAVLAEHGAEGSRAHVQCLCGEWEHRQTWPGEPDTWFGASYRTHVAAALDAALAAMPEPYDERLVTCPECRSTFEAEDSTPVAAQEGERGGAEVAAVDNEPVGLRCPECDLDEFEWPCPGCGARVVPQSTTHARLLAAFKREHQWRMEAAATVEAVLRSYQARREPFGNDLVSAVRAALADPAGALASVKAEVLRAAADDMPIKMWGRDGWQQWFRQRADRIAGDQP